MRARVQLPAIGLVVLMSLSGCVSQPARVPANVPENLAQLAHWQARGRIAVSGAQGGGSGSFQWQQQQDQADVQIRGPIGIGSVRLRVQGDAADPEVRLQTGDGAILESQAAWDELEARLGAPVPAGRLRFWMLGLAAPGEHQWQQVDEAGAKTLDQDGWHIVYQQYADNAGAHVPVRMQATSGATRVRIVVDRWQLGE